MKPSIQMLLVCCVLLFCGCRLEKTEVLVPGPGSAQPNSQGLSIFDIALSATSFNPSRGDTLECRYSLSRDARVTVQVFDADQQLVRTLVSDSQKTSGQNKETWDGKDSEGMVVPNEAYFFNIEAEDADRNRVVYDPVTFSGGESADLRSRVPVQTRGVIDPEGTSRLRIEVPRPDFPDPAVEGVPGRLDLGRACAGERR